MLHMQFYGQLDDRGRADDPMPNATVRQRQGYLRYQFLPVSYGAYRPAVSADQPGHYDRFSAACREYVKNVSHARRP